MVRAQELLQLMDVPATLRPKTITRTPTPEKQGRAKRVPVEKALNVSVARQSRPVNHFQSEPLADFGYCNARRLSSPSQLHGVGKCRRFGERRCLAARGCLGKRSRLSTDRSRAKPLARGGFA